MKKRPRRKENKMARDMGSKGKMQGDMNPVVSDYQKPMSSYSQEGFSKTLDYIERKDAQENKSAREIKNIDYKGRYS